MMDFHKIEEQFKFIKSNRSDIERLLKLRFELISLNLASLLKSILYGLVLVGVALLFFFFSFVSVFFGLTELIRTSDMGIWLFFGVGGLFIVLFFALVLWAVGCLSRSVKSLNGSIKDLGSEIELVLGRDGSSEQLSEKLEADLKQQLEQVS